MGPFVNKPRYILKYYFDTIKFFKYIFFRLFKFTLTKCSDISHNLTSGPCVSSFPEILHGGSDCDPWWPVGTVVSPSTVVNVSTVAQTVTRGDLLVQ